MISELAVVGDEYFVIGFQMVGVKHGFVVDRKTVNKTMEEVMERKDVGIVMMDNTSFDALNERLKERAMIQVKPTVVVLSHDVSAEQNLRLLIRRALGIDVWGQQESSKVLKEGTPK